MVAERGGRALPCAGGSASRRPDEVTTSPTLRADRAPCKLRRNSLALGALGLQQRGGGGALQGDGDELVRRLLQQGALLRRPTQRRDGEGVVLGAALVVRHREAHARPL